MCFLGASDWLLRRCTKRAKVFEMSSTFLGVSSDSMLCGASVFELEKIDWVCVYLTLLDSLVVTSKTNSGSL